jgi:hypothetical protein
MSEVAEIVKTVHDIIKVNEDIPVVVENSKLGMAYAIPKGTEDTVIETYSPWQRAEVKQVFFRQSSFLGSVLAEIQLIMSWNYSGAKQYIVEAYLDRNVISIDPTASVSISVRFDQPRPMTQDPLEAYEIPFQVTVDFRPVGDNSITIFHGIIRADGTGHFATE